MARKSKRLALADVKSPVPENIYNVAIYIRLSIEDKLYKNGSDSLKNQESLILDYLQDKPDMKVYAVYCDNGETGTDFEREDFQRMMYDVYNGKVNCIIVKDLSRFGREYIETGDYLEKIFPLIGVRFIAINDKYDNKVNPFDITVPIKNIINTLYARDLSQKSAAALRIKQENGEFIGSYAAYGYKKSSDDKHKLIIDEEAASVVRMIFEWKSQGMGSGAICRKLNELNIMPPARYRYDNGIIKDKRCEHQTLWKIPTIKSLLQNEVYIGNLVQGRRKSQFYDGKPEIRCDKSNWVVVENTHEPIVPKELFDKVQIILQDRYSAYHRNLGKYDKISNKVNIFKGKIICGDCGNKLVRYKNACNSSKKARYTYICPQHANFPDKCSFLSMDESMLKNIVLQSINTQISYLTNIELMLQNAAQSQVVRKKKIVVTKEISDILSNISYIKTSRIRTATDYAKKLLNDEEYKMLMADFDNELRVETEKLEIVNKQKDKLERILSSAAWISELRKYKGAKKLTLDLVDSFIRNIKIYSDKRVEIEWAYAEKLNIEDGDSLAG